MIAPRRQQKAYDHRLRDYIYQQQSIDFALSRGIPRSTAAGWLKYRRQVISIKAHDATIEQLESLVISQAKRIQRLRAIIHLLAVALQLSGFRFESRRLPQGKHKLSLLNALENTSKYVRLDRVLHWIGLSRSRYFAWRSERECGLSDVSSCPKSLTNQITSDERTTMFAMVTSNDFRHMGLSALARLAGRLGKVYASSSTWLRAARDGKWIRPRKRTYPAKPRIGIRATKPNEYWHIDVSRIRLMNGVVVYLHAIIDNFSRRILTWRVNPSFDTKITSELLIEASKEIKPVNMVPSVVMDCGVENVNSSVDAIVSEGKITRILAQVDVSFSNSMIEAWWRCLKHNWLFINPLDSAETVRCLVHFYVDQHNRVVPHSAFKGQTPDEMYFGTGSDVPKQLKEQHATAIAKRIAHNREVSCTKCQSVDSKIVESPISTSIKSEQRSEPLRN